MCTYNTETVTIRGSVKVGGQWSRATDATIYFDHPVHHESGHALMIDVLGSSLTSEDRVALELDPESARSLAEAILRTLALVPSVLLSESTVP